MMLLCIESSSDPTLLGLCEGETLIAETMLENRDTLPQAVADMLAQAGLSPKELRAIVIGTGPGSFTGLRVGLAFAQGVARAAGIPLWPLPSLKVFAANVAKQFETVAAFSFARRGQAHLQLFNGADLSAATVSRVIEYEKLESLLPAACALVGPAVNKLAPELAQNLKRFLPPDNDCHRAHAAIMATLALTEWQHQPAPEAGKIVPDYGLEFGN